MDSKEIQIHFDQYVFAKGLSKHTCAELSFCVKEFLLYLESNNILNLELISEATISNYHHYLINRKKHTSNGKLSGSTPNHHVYALKTLFAWLYNIDAISYNPMLDLQLPKSYSTKTSALPKEIIKKLFSVTQSDLERVVLAIYYGCGLRRTEGVNLIVSDIDLHASQVLVRKGKFNKRRIVPINKSILIHFQNYYSSEHQNKLNKDVPFLLNSDSKPLSGKHAYGIIKNLRHRAGLNNFHITLHVLRHSIATHLFESGLSIELIQKFLGHQSSDVSYKYISVSNNRNKRKAFFQ